MTTHELRVGAKDTARRLLVEKVQTVGQVGVRQAVREFAQRVEEMSPEGLLDIASSDIVGYPLQNKVLALQQLGLLHRNKSFDLDAHSGQANVIEDVVRRGAGSAFGSQVLAAAFLAGAKDYSDLVEDAAVWKSNLPVSDGAKDQLDYEMEGLTRCLAIGICALGREWPQNLLLPQWNVYQKLVQSGNVSQGDMGHPERIIRINQRILFDEIKLRVPSWDHLYIVSHLGKPKDSYLRRSDLTPGNLTAIATLSQLTPSDNRNTEVPLLHTRIGLDMNGITQLSGDQIEQIDRRLGMNASGLRGLLPKDASEFMCEPSGLLYFSAIRMRRWLQHHEVNLDRVSWSEFNQGFEFIWDRLSQPVTVTEMVANKVASRKDVCLVDQYIAEQKIISRSIDPVHLEKSFRAQLAVALLEKNREMTRVRSEEQIRSVVQEAFSLHGIPSADRRQFSEFENPTNWRLLSETVWLRRTPNSGYIFGESEQEN